MKKKLISAAVIAALTVSCSAAMAADNDTPTVYVNKSEVFFADQAPVIVSDRTLIPARGVFEAMGAKVEWDADARLVEVTSADNKTAVWLTIDDSTMRVFDLSDMVGTLAAGQDFTAPETQVTLDVAPQILSDRTMIPLRAISEAINAKVEWDGASRSVDITTADAGVKEGAPALTLSASADSVKEGDTVDLYVNASGFEAENSFISSVTATVKYDKENFEFVSAQLMNGETPVEGALGAENPNFAEGYAKAAYVTIDEDKAAKTAGTVMKMTFKSKNGQAGSFALSNGYHTELAHNTVISVDTVVDKEVTSLSFVGDDLNIDTTPVTVNAQPAE